MAANFVRELTPNIYQLKKLSRLNISGNGLIALPAEIAQCPLSELELSANLLTTLPDSLGSCLTLRAINISGNPRFKYIPPSVAAIPGLRIVFRGGSVQVSE